MSLKFFFRKQIFNRNAWHLLKCLSHLFFALANKNCPRDIHFDRSIHFECHFNYKHIANNWMTRYASFQCSNPLNSFFFEKNSSNQTHHIKNTNLLCLPFEPSIRLSIVAIVVENPNQIPELFHPLRTTWLRTPNSVVLGCWPLVPGHRATINGPKVQNLVWCQQSNHEFHSDQIVLFLIASLWIWNNK